FKYLDYSIFQKRHISPTEIGRRLRIGEKTVRERIRKMEEEGFIKYYEALPNFSLFSLQNIGMFNFETEDIPSKQLAISRMVKSLNVVDIYDMIGPAFSVTIAESSVENILTRAHQLTKESNLKKDDLKFGERKTDVARIEP